MLKNIALVLNLLLLGFALYFLCEHGVPDMADNNDWIFLFLGSVGIVNILFILLLPDPKGSWISLLFKRKILEGELEIEKLKERKCPHCGKEL